MKIKIIAAIMCLVQLYSSTIRSDMPGAATVTDKLAASIFEGGAQDLLRTTQGTETCVIEQGNAKSYSAGSNSFANAVWRAFNLLQSCSLFTKQEPVRTSYEERKPLPPIVSDESLGLGAIGIGER